MFMWAIDIFPRSVCLIYSAGGKYSMWTNPRNIHINRSQTHECGNWNWGRAIPFLGIHKWDFRCSVEENIRFFFDTLFINFREFSYEMIRITSSLSLQSLEPLNSALDLIYIKYSILFLSPTFRLFTQNLKVHFWIGKTLQNIYWKFFYASGEWPPLPCILAKWLRGRWGKGGGNQCYLTRGWPQQLLAWPLPAKVWPLPGGRGSLHERGGAAGRCGSRKP